MRLIWIAGSLAVACVVVAACGDETGAPSGRATRPEPMAPRFVSGPACETARIGQACTGPELCELGDADDIACNRLLRCNGFAWELAQAARSCMACKGREAGTCGALCGFEGDGVICGCELPAEPADDAGSDAGTETDGGDGGDGGDNDAGSDGGVGELDEEAGADAGVDARFEPGTPSTETGAGWRCVEVRRGCPRRRPRIGEPCVKPMSCDYGACTLDRGVAIACSGGFWVEDAIPCPR